MWVKFLFSLCVAIIILILVWTNFKYRAGNELNSNSRAEAIENGTFYMDLNVTDLDTGCAARKTMLKGWIEKTPAIGSFFSRSKDNGYNVVLENAPGYDSIVLVYREESEKLMRKKFIHQHSPTNLYVARIEIIPDSFSLLIFDHGYMFCSCILIHAELK